MTIKTLTTVFREIEQASARNDKTMLLAEILKKAKTDEIRAVVYLSLGVLGPVYRALEFNLSEKLLMRAVALGFDKTVEQVGTEFKLTGDLGDVVAKLATLHGVSKTSESVQGVYQQLLKIANLAGVGSQEEKIKIFADLLKRLDPQSAGVITRIPLGKMRLGFSEMTMVDALSWMVSGDKSNRGVIEHAFNVSADIGRIAEQIKIEGIEGLLNAKVITGVPVRPAAAERLPSAKAIIEKLGEVMVEPKIDGFRLQCHYVSDRDILDSAGEISETKKRLFDEADNVRIYSRNLENMTAMFPDLISEIRKLTVKEIVFEGEAVAYDRKTGRYLPFQETIQRRRKHNIEAKSDEIPLKLVAFDLLKLDGEVFIDKSLTERRNVLANIVSNRQGVIEMVESANINSGDGLSKIFNEYMDKGLEGVMCKRPDAPYAAGARNFNWVKLKREEGVNLNDSIDCLVLGYKYGQGKRNQFGIGAFLAAVYADQAREFKTVSNIGTGLTDDQWREMRARCDKLALKDKPTEYQVPKEVEPDVWIKPAMVVEILADEITRSPIHTAGKTKDEPGYALRFPRLVQWRYDKSPDQVTTESELISMFRQQKKRSRQNNQ